MTIAHNNLTLQKPLRLWPGVALAILQLLVRYAVPVLFPEKFYIGLLGGLAIGVLILLWWLFFSRAPWLDRIVAVAAMVIVLFVVHRLTHISIRTGAMGFLFFVLATPILTSAFVAWAVITRNLSLRARRVTMVATMFLACGVWMLIRTGGFTGDFEHDFAWRWSETHEEQLLAQQRQKPSPSRSAQTGDRRPEVKPPVAPQGQTPAQLTEEKPAQPSASPKQYTEAEWPGFRGPNRDGVIHGVQIKTDWTASPPKELWRQPVGPGWSSFAVDGDRIYTQEQLGDEELVTCYNIKNGERVWTHKDATRFWESNAGAGPRGTPTLYQGRVYTLGATGILNALNAGDGTVVWSRNAASDSGTTLPGWGYSGSPLVVEDTVIVASSGTLVGYDLDTGKLRWKGPKGGTDYSSPHRITIGGVPQVLLMSGSGVTSLAPASGKVLWKYPMPSGTRIVQPAVMEDGDVLINEGDMKGMRRIDVARAEGKWNVKELWKSIGLKPYFNHFVVHEGHAYGFDGSYLSCIDLNDGNRKWKGGKYGHGQLVLLADQDAMIVVSEKGEVALVGATPDQFKELGKFKAIDGKTWNHPVLVGDTLLVRNGEEMAAFRLAVAKQ